MREHRIHFLPGKKTGHFETGTTFRDAGLALGIVIESSCAGIGTCAKCKVNVKGSASEPAKVEEELLTPSEISKGVRLSCQASVTGNSVCLVPEESQSFSEVILTEGVRGHFPLDPDTRKIFVELPQARLGEKYFDLERLEEELAIKGYNVSSIRLPGVRHLPNLLRSHDQKVTVVLDDDEMMTVEGGTTTETLFGVAFDIGTTTVAARLLNMNTGQVSAVASTVNPQKNYGADVISRISHIVEHSGGLELLHRLIIKTMNELVENICSRADVPRDDIYKASIAGNTVMQHIVLNLDPRHLAYKPYTPVFRGPATVPADDIGLQLNRHATAYVIPNLACFVGSDITAVLTNLDMEEQDDVQLVVDIGTNGEMVLGSKERLLCCSSPAGPAWEGAYITWGMRAAHGAIERASIVDGELEFRTIGNREPLGICGSGLLDLVCEFVRASVIDPSGRILSVEELNPAVSESLKSRIVHRTNGANDITIAEIDQEKSVMLLQKDIREVQLAKSAIASGIKILMKELGVKAEDIKQVYVAGAFGNHVRGEDAIDSGLLPEVSPEQVKFIGNASLAGAEAILLSRKARKKAEHLSEIIEYVEISERDDFHELFVQSMHFPVGNS
ncbi:MAG: ASKHA domain-containing protein [Candidatus Neomarinimicrobiota bacterium]